MAPLFRECFTPESDARLFEVAAYVLLRQHYARQTVVFGATENEAHKVELQLYRTGRTNANDGGIDYVLLPAGRFFQATETLDFGKYFLDFVKVNHFPFTFVIKTELSPSEVLEVVGKGARRSGYSDDEVKRYLSLFEEIFTVPILEELLSDLSPTTYEVQSMKSEMVRQFELEYGLLD